MASINRLKPDQIVWTLIRRRMGNTTATRQDLFSVRIIEVHVEEGYVIASFNGNKPDRYGLINIKKWRVKKPEPKGTRMGYPYY